MFINSSFLILLVKELEGGSDGLEGWGVLLLRGSRWFHARLGHVSVDLRLCHTLKGNKQRVGCEEGERGKRTREISHLERHDLG